MVNLFICFWLRISIEVNLFLDYVDVILRIVFRKLLRVLKIYGNDRFLGYLFLCLYLCFCNYVMY